MDHIITVDIRHCPVLKRESNIPNKEIKLWDDEDFVPTRRMKGVQRICLLRYCTQQYQYPHCTRSVLVSNELPPVLGSSKLFLQ
jgi:hypothetical protein